MKINVGIDHFNQIVTFAPTPGQKVPGRPRCVTVGYDGVLSDWNSPYWSRILPIVAEMLLGGSEFSISLVNGSEIEAK